VKKLYTTILLLFFISNLIGQTIHVIDGKTGKPIEGVLLFSEEFSTQTNQKGEAAIKNFALKSVILFKHSSFLPYTTTKENIEKQSKTILLIEDPVRLDEVVVSVSRWKQSKAEIPHTIKSIKSDDVLHFNPQTTADLLGVKGGVFIQKSQMGGGSPMIRGFAANRVLIVVDGIRMNNAIYRSGNLHNVISLDVNNLESTEVIFGPGSVIYGSDALGGVISFSTYKPKLSTSRAKETVGKLFTRYSSANFEKTVNGFYSIGSKKWAAIVSATFTDFDDLRMGANGPDYYLRSEYVSERKFTGTDVVIQNNNRKVQKYSGYNQLNLLGRLRFRPNENLDFLVNVHHSQTGNIPRYDRLIQYKNEKPKYANWYYGSQKWTMFSGQIQYNNKHALFDRMNLLVGYQNYIESRNDRKLNNENLRNRTENLDIFSFNLDFGKTFDKNSSLFYGIEINTNKVHSTGISENLLSGENVKIASRYPNGSLYKSVAGYYSFKYILSKQFIVQMGSRFTYTLLQGTFDPKFYNFPFEGFNMKNSAFNGNLGVVWHPTKEWQINIHSSTGFRSPNIDDVAKVFDSEPGNVLVPNPDLKPEYARNLELSILRSYAKKARIEITGFYTWLKDAMVRRSYSLNGHSSILYDGTMSNVEALVNAESASIIGANLTFEYIITNELRTSNNLTITKGEDSDGLPVRHVPPTFGSSHLIYEKQKLYVDLYVDYSGGFNYNQLATSEQDKPHLYLPDKKGRPHSPSWYTVNLKSNYKINQNITLGGGIENILDRRYRTYSSGIVSPGINFIVSVNARF
jgi:hemoglobin/transferrin/lactoferrin receptor protein